MKSNGGVDRTGFQEHVGDLTLPRTMLVIPLFLSLNHPLSGLAFLPPSSVVIQTNTSNQNIRCLENTVQCVKGFYSVTS